MGPGKVLVVTAEDDWEDTVVPRLMAAGADLARIYRLDDLEILDGAADLDRPAQRGDDHRPSVEVSATALVVNITFTETDWYDVLLDQSAA